MQMSAINLSQYCNESPAKIKRKWMLSIYCIIYIYIYSYTLEYTEFPNELLWHIVIST